MVFTGGNPARAIRAKLPPLLVGLPREQTRNPILPSDHHARRRVSMHPGRVTMTVSPLPQITGTILMLRNSGNLVGGVMQGGYELVHFDLLRGVSRER
jgi:hypothetical protein